MLRIMIECSRTGQLIATGIETDEASFAMLPNVTTETYCAHCRRYHRWSKDDVCLDPFTAEAIVH
jgi:hypothetical protein